MANVLEKKHGGDSIEFSTRRGNEKDYHQQAPKVYLVGAGPGDPRLITVAGAQRIAEADVVLYDYLVNHELLADVDAGTELICLGHHSTGRIMSQEEINTRMIESARQGKVVVRLKCGDPCVFGRSAEEIAALVDAEIAFEIVPGVTAGIAAGACARVPLTRASDAPAVALVTGWQRGDDTLLDYAALASFPGTLVSIWA
ncbi:MAG: uroporphyrinogen-III C-methyltransferase [Planctomycetota bacterium]|nr:uroporphyrinogen-III C-methyltransferase [Planctomycetota bacterium]